MKIIKTPFVFSFVPRNTKIKAVNADGWELWWLGYKFFNVKYKPLPTKKSVFDFDK